MRLLLFALCAGAATCGGVLLAGMQPDPIADRAATPAEGAYTAQVRRAGIDGESDAYLLAVGRGLCLGIGQSPSAEVRPVPVSGISPAATHAIVDASTRYLCTGQRSKVTSYLGTR